MRWGGRPQPAPECCADAIGLPKNEFDAPVAGATG